MGLVFLQLGAMMQEAVKLLKAELEAFVALLFFAAREMALVAALAGVM